MFSLQARLCFAFGLILLLSRHLQAAECPATHLNEARETIRNASGCQAGIAIYESCGAKASSYVNLVALADAAQKRCEQIFLDNLHGYARREYKRLVYKCEKKDYAQPLVFVPTPRIMCGPYLALNYARIYVTAKEKVAKNPNPPL